MLRYSLIFLFALLASCGARKVDIAKNDTKITIDSSSVVKKEEIVAIKNNIVVNTDTDEVEVVPVDSVKPMIVNGKTYFNAKIKYKKTKASRIDLSDKKVVKKEDMKVIKTNKTKKLLFKKNIDRKESYFSYLWIIILLLLLFYYGYKKLN